MLRRIVCPAVAVIMAATMSGVTGTSADGFPAPAASTAQPAVTGGMVEGFEAGRRPDAGPPYEFTTELMGDGVLIPLPDKAMITRTKHGYLYRTGQQDNHLVITRVDGRLRFADTGTRSFKKLAPGCRRKAARVGVAAVCRIPGGISVRQPLLVEVWPRLGNDYMDASTLPATFAVTMLGDAGHDVARFGAGPDFFNGHSGRDRIWGGAGKDWIRAGLDNDTVNGGRGADDIVAMQGQDNVHAGRGDDRVDGGEHSDRLWGDTGADFLLCGTGRDRVWVDSGDRSPRDCEAVDRG